MPPVDAHCNESIESFLEATEIALAAYRHSTLTFVSIVHEGYEAILRGRLALSVESLRNEVPSPRALGLRVEQLSLPLDVRMLRKFIVDVSEGQPIIAGDHSLVFLRDHARSCGGHHEDAEIIYRRTGRVEEKLLLTGTNPWPMLSPGLRGLERSLRAQGFESLNELLGECGFGRLDMTGECAFEVVAGPVARLDAASVVLGSEAVLEVKLARGLLRDAFQVTLRNAVRGEKAFRQTIWGAEFSWTDVGDYAAGRISVPLPRNSRFLCQAFYTDRFQDQRVLFDPIDRLVNNAIMVAVPNREHTGAATEGFC